MNSLTSHLKLTSNLRITFIGKYFVKQFCYFWKIFGKSFPKRIFLTLSSFLLNTLNSNIKIKSYPEVFNLIQGIKNMSFRLGRKFNVRGSKCLGLWKGRDYFISYVRYISGKPLDILEYMTGINRMKMTDID